MIKERTKEIREIKNFLSKKGLAALLVYGHKNVGKKSLVHLASKDSLSKKIFLNVKGENKNIIVQEVKSKCSSLFPGIDLPVSDDIIQNLKFFFEESVNQKIILVIDDIEELIKICPNISLFFDNFRGRFKATANIKIICLTSYPRLKSEYENHNSKAKSLFDGLIEVEDFNYLEASSFYSKTALLEEKLLYFSVFGGLPLYNSMLNQSKSFVLNLKELLLYRNSPLRNKIENDISKITTKKFEADELLTILAKKKLARYGELKDEFKSKGLTGDFDYILNKLMEIGVITKNSPLHYENDKKKFFYKIEDPLYDFFYSHVYYNTESDVLPEEIDKTYENIIKKELEEQFFPRRLIFMTIEFLKREGKKGKFKEEVMNVAPYFSNPQSLEFDGTIVVETLSGNYYVLVNTSKRQLERTRVEELAHSLYEKLKPYKNLILVSRGMFASNINRTKYITYRMASMYSKV